MVDDVPANKVLILVWPEASAYNATFRLARVLRERGVQVVYAAPAAWQERIARQGFASVLIEDVGMKALGASGAPWPRRLWAARREAERLLDELCASLAWVRDQGFSLALLHHTLWYSAPALRRLGIPVISVSPSLTSHWNLEIPPLFSSWTPPRGPRPWAALRCAGAWAALRYLGAFNHRYRGIMQPLPTSLSMRLRDAWGAASVPNAHRAAGRADLLCLPAAGAARGNPCALGRRWSPPGGVRMDPWPPGDGLSPATASVLSGVCGGLRRYRSA